MRNLFRKPIYFLMIAAIAPCFIFSAANAQDLTDNVTQLAAEEVDIEAIWTEEAQAEAQSYPMPEVDEGLSIVNQEASELPAEPPGFVSGTLPNSYIEPESWEDTEPQLYRPPGNYNTGYPPPVNRWTYFAKYSNHPIATVGKLFFSQDHDGNGTGSSFVCSGSVIYGGPGQRDVIATAGHCVNNGLNGRGFNRGWSYNIQFCPSYYSGGVAPAIGCWGYDALAAKTGWIQGGNPNGLEYDVGCVVASNTGTRQFRHIGDVTGTLGRAYNWGADEPETAFGYPQGSPFNGTQIIIVPGVDWYTRSFGAAADAKYMGNDMTGGSSGGPWVLGLGRSAGSGENPDTDGNTATDPPGYFRNAGGFINGVNSHRLSSRSQEMGSPQFNTTSPDTESLWATCQGLANSN